MRINNIKIRWRLSIGFLLVIVLTLIAGLISISTIQELSGLTTKMHEHPLIVGNAIRDIRTNIIAMHRSMKDVVLADNLDEIKDAAAIVDEREKETIALFNIVLDRFLGDKRTVKDALREFAGWKVIRDEVIELMKKGDKQLAADITKGKGKRYIDHLNIDIEMMAKFAAGKSDSFYANALDTKQQMIRLTLLIIALISMVSIIVAIVITRSIVTPFGNMLTQVNDIAKGNYASSLPIDQTDEAGHLSSAINKMSDSLRDLTDSAKKQDWVKTGQNELSKIIRGDPALEKLADNVTQFLAEYLDAKMGALYVMNVEGSALDLTGSYAFVKRKSINDRILVKEGLVGQAAHSKTMISPTSVPADYTRITSATGSTVPVNIVVTPFMYEDNVLGVLELAALQEFSDIKLEFLEASMESIAVGVNSARTRTVMKDLLDNSRALAEKLESQQEELKVSNEELQEKTKELQASEEELKSQQEELMNTNEELEAKTSALEEQQEEVNQRNIDLQKAQRELEKRAGALETASRYKSEFLANMSHELRTPLNSLLLLSSELASNKKNNLSKDDVESAEIIYSSGNDLLKLIDDILDLSKIEAGRMTLNIDNVILSEMEMSINSSFKRITKEKGLDLTSSIDNNIPQLIRTDRQRLEQITRNLMSNAIKFTERGSINIKFHRPASDVDLSLSGLDHQKSIAISVKDEGIGIPPDKQSEIFEAFRQVDGSISREYGGTGLGLSISRELARLLGGEIHLASIEGEGSTFTVYMPEVLLDKKRNEADAGQVGLIKERRSRLVDYKDQAADRPSPSIKDDRDELGEHDKVLLVIEDDMSFAEILLKVSHERGFKCIHAGNGETGLGLADEYKPDAIILDLELPGIKGQEVLEALKSNPGVRHIPVHIMSVADAAMDTGKSGAIGYLKKPVNIDQLQQAFARIEDMVSREIKKLLIVEDDEDLRKSLKILIGNNDIQTFETGNGNDAIEMIKSDSYDCVILDLKLPDMSGFEVLEKLNAAEEVTLPPIIIYTGRDLTREEERKLRQFASSIIIKGVRSDERLLDETALFLHRVVDNLPQNKKEMISRLYDSEAIFRDKKILIVDDDMRNIIAVSKMLEAREMNVFKAYDGRKALEILDEEPDIDLVLMDIMMPVMDGYEAIKQIRSQERFNKLPVLAVTAKAMQEDYEKSIAAGANDYLSKPIKTDKLLSLMRVWLYK